MMDEPRFAQPIPNVTVAVGRDANLPCVVEHLGAYKVNIVMCTHCTTEYIVQCVCVCVCAQSAHHSIFLLAKIYHITFNEQK